MQGTLRKGYITIKQLDSSRKDPIGGYFVLNGILPWTIHRINAGLVFCPTKKNCESVAQMVSRSLPRSLLEWKTAEKRRLKMALQVRFLLFPDKLLIFPYEFGAVSFWTSKTSFETTCTLLLFLLLFQRISFCFNQETFDLSPPLTGGERSTVSHLKDHVAVRRGVSPLGSDGRRAPAHRGGLPRRRPLLPLLHLHAGRWSQLAGATSSYLSPSFLFIHLVEFVVFHQVFLTASVFTPFETL